jgi:hypothetical protein
MAVERLGVKGALPHHIDGTGALRTIAMARPLSVRWPTLRRLLACDCSGGVELKTFQLHEDQWTCDRPIISSYPPALPACC